MMEKVFQYLNDLLYDTDGAQWSDLCDEFLLYGVTDQKTAEGNAVIDIGAGPKT